jgi:hypothetical protein
MALMVCFETGYCPMIFVRSCTIYETDCYRYRNMSTHTTHLWICTNGYDPYLARKASRSTPRWRSAHYYQQLLGIKRGSLNTWEISYVLR